MPFRTAGSRPGGARHGGRPILVIDEVHHFRPEVLEDLRLPTNYKMDAENLLCLLLLGQTELRRRLSIPVYEALS